MRQRAAQKEPPVAGVAPFPRSTVAKGEILYRSTTPANSPGYFSSNGSGRFDLPYPEGTLYAARSVHTAAMERIAAPVVTSADGRVRQIDGPYMAGGIEEEDAEQILIWELAPERRLEVANLTDQGAAVFGVTMELSGGGGPDMYDLAQKWSAAFRSERFDGVEYSSRFTSSTSVEDNAVAVFGPSGAATGPFAIAERARTLVELARVAGINVRIAKCSAPPEASGSL